MKIIKRLKSIIKDGKSRKWNFLEWFLIIYDFIRHPEYPDYPFAYTDNLDLNLKFCDSMVVKRFVKNNKQWVWLIR